jgi:hypothetical protein
MDDKAFQKILAALKVTDPVEVQAVRILIQIGEALAHGNTAPLESILNIQKMSDATAAKVFFLILMGVLFEASHASSQEKFDRMEAFERGWKSGFDRGFLKVQS